MLTNVENPETYSKISVSELNTLLRCSKKHDYAYRQGLRPLETPSYLSAGSYLHKLMETFLSKLVAGQPFDLETDSIATQAAILEERGTTVTEPDRLTTNVVFQAWLEEIEAAGIDLQSYIARLEDGSPMLEREFLVDVGWRSLDDEPVLLHGVVDLVGQRDGEWWVNEHKRTSRAWSISQLQFANQGPLYLAALRTLFPDQSFGGVQYNFFYPKAAEVKQIYISDEHMEVSWQEAQAAIHLRDTGSITRQPHWGCQDCWFRTVCVAELMGMDSSLVRETQFRVDETKASRFAGAEE